MGWIFRKGWREVVPLSDLGNRSLGGDAFSRAYVLRHSDSVSVNLYGLLLMIDNDALKLGRLLGVAQRRARMPRFCQHPPRVQRRCV